jgi:predicted SprT family Zn-dependent metalloprotease
MPWRCPACGIQIQHSEAETAPRPGVRYRCHVCRLELVLDGDGHKLTVPPLGDDERRDPRR